MAISKSNQETINKVANGLALFAPIAIMILTAVVYHPKDLVPIVDHLQVKNSFAEKFFAISLMLWFLLSYWRNHLVIARNKIAYSLYLLFALGIISLLWSVFTGHTLTKLLLWFAPAALIFLFYQGVKKEQHLGYIIQGVFWAGFAVAILGCGQYLFGWDFVAQAANPCSTFGNKNMACHMVVLALPVAFYLILAKPQPVWKDALFSFALMIMAAFLFYTRTRSAWGAVAIELLVLLGFIVLGGYKHLNLTPQKFYTVALALLGFLFMATLNESFLAEGRPVFVQALDIFSAEAGSAIEGAQGGNIRFIIWPAAIELFQQAPWIGHGLGTFFYAYPETYELQGHSIRYAHNEFLELAVELGILGLLVLAICVFYILKAIFSLFVKAKSVDKVLVAVILAALIGTCINAMYSFVYAHLAPMLLLGSLLFVLMALTERYQSEQLQGESFIGRVVEYTEFKKAVLIPLVCLFALGVYAINLHWQSDITKLNQNMRAGSWKTQIELPSAEFMQLPNYNWIFYSAASNTRGPISFNAAKALYEVYPRHYDNAMILARYYMNWDAFDKALPVLNDAIKVRPRGTLRPLLLKLSLIEMQQGRASKDFADTLKEIEDTYQKEKQMSLRANTLDDDINWLRNYIMQSQG